MTIPSIFLAIYGSLQSLVKCLVRNGNTVINSIAVFTFLVIAGQFWYSRSERNLVLFVGSPGSSTSSIGPMIADRIRSTASPGGATYNITVESTPDNISLRERMSSENNRYALGIVEDGNGFESNDDKGNSLRVLLPLEWDYLYVLCSKKLYERVWNKKKKAETLADVFDEIGDGMLYLGPEKSSTHRIATLALSKFGEVPINKIAKGIADWREMRSALKRGELELVFAKGPLGTGLLQEVANDESAVLLSLGPITDAVQREGGFQVYAAELPENLCTAQPFEISKKISAYFCRPDLKTFASRRVLACPASLSTADAYLIATVARKACEEDQYHVNLMANDLPRGGDSKDSTLTSELRMPIHPGLKYLRSGETPFVLRDWATWPAWLNTVLGALLGLLVLDLLNLLSKYLKVAADGDNNADDVPLPTSTDEFLPNMEYAQFSRVLTTYGTSVQTHLHTDQQMTEWDSRLRNLRAAIRSSSKLTSKQREVLLEGVRELRLDTMSSHWATRKAPPTESASVSNQPSPQDPQSPEPRKLEPPDLV